MKGRIGTRSGLAAPVGLSLLLLGACAVRDRPPAAPGPGSAATALQLEIRPLEGFLDSLGVCTHLLGTSERELELMKQAGIRHLRDEIGWALVEEKPGEFHVPPEREAWVNEAVRQGIDVLLILDYGNPIYPDKGVGSAKNPERDFDLFGRYVEFMVRHFKDRVHQWEIWNEPNGFELNGLYGGDWSGGPWVEAYARLADRTVPRIRAIDPSAGVMTAGMEAPIANLVAPHLKEHYDAIAIHPYCYPLLPEYVNPGILELQETLRRTGHTVPLIVTEWGYPTLGGVGAFLWKHSGTITLDDQARFLLRVYCGNFRRGIPRTYWYDFICDGTDPANGEHNFGIVNAGASSPRPAYSALKTLTTFLNRKPAKPEAQGPEAVAGQRVEVGVDPAASVPLRGLLLARSAVQYYLIVWKESPAKDRLEVRGSNGAARVFHDDGAPERVHLAIPGFSAGRLEATFVDPMLGMDSVAPVPVANDGTTHLLEVSIKESPVVVELSFQ